MVLTSPERGYAYISFKDFSFSILTFLETKRPDFMKKDARMSWGDVRREFEKGTVPISRRAEETSTRRWCSVTIRWITSIPLSVSSLNGS